MPHEAEAVDDTRPFVLFVEGPGGGLIAAVNRAAAAEGLAPGDRLADARARCGPLQVRPADPAADDAALRRLALWATRYAPTVAVWGEAEGADGLFIDISGAEHLFGGEAGLSADLAERLHRLGLPARLAVADTPGAAWALARFARSARTLLPSGGEAAALAPLPVAALRLPAQTRQPLQRLGFKRVGDLLDQPRAPFAARFEKALLLRLDQALGHAPEALVPVTPPPLYRAQRQLLEPVLAQAAVVIVARRLMADLAPQLARGGVGARTLQLALYRVDGAVRLIDIGLAVPTRDPAHVARLVDLKLDRLGPAVDAGFGFEAFALSVTQAEPMAERQASFATAAATDRWERRTALVDGLRQRLGPHSVAVPAPVASHRPERSEAMVDIGADCPAWPAPDPSRLRPILLLAAPEPADVVALLPDGPPRRLRWRGASHAIARLQGPERIANEWWRQAASPPPSALDEQTRDYFLAEDEAGRRLWLFREVGHAAPPRWFVHGLFA